MPDTEEICELCFEVPKGHCGHKGCRYYRPAADLDVPVRKVQEPTSDSVVVSHGVGAGGSAGTHALRGSPSPFSVIRPAGKAQLATDESVVCEPSGPGEDRKVASDKGTDAPRRRPFSPPPPRKGQLATDESVVEKP